mgnify:CR=1 FL=1
MIRTFAHDTVLELAEYASVPVINALTDLLHPCQAMADMMTAIEYKGKDLKGKKLTFIGDGNNMAHSLMFACAKLGLTLPLPDLKGMNRIRTLLPKPKRMPNSRAALLKS